MRNSLTTTSLKESGIVMIGFLASVVLPAVKASSIKTCASNEGSCVIFSRAFIRGVIHWEVALIPRRFD